MTQAKYFDNTYSDYVNQDESLLAVDNSLKPITKVVTGLNEKWESTLSKFKYLDQNDCSIYTGTAGLALLLLKQGGEKKETWEEARKLVPFQRHLSRHCHTFLCGDAGPLALNAVLNHKLGQKIDCDRAVQKLKDMQTSVFNVNSELANEYLYGRAGYLYAILYINKHITPKPCDDNFIRKIIESILICGRDGAKAGKFKCPLMYQWHDSYYLGAAHGVSGIIYLLLQIREYLTDAELNSLIKPTVDYLVGLRFPSHNFPSSLGRERDTYVQWCHGAPGFLYMFTAAYRVFGDPKYLQFALDCGDVVWQRGLLRKGYSICHGVSGNGYCFLELYQTTHEEKHLYRAIKFAEWCLDYTKKHEEYTPDRPLSLYEGIAGPMYYLIDIQRPLEAKFPGQNFQPNTKKNKF